MYTVIILNKRSSELFAPFKFLFNPFIQKGEIAICDWNEGGTDVSSSVPDLYKFIRGKKKWRALILNTDSLYGYFGSPEPKRSNPFDFSEVDSSSEPHVSPIPQIRLSHILCGYASEPATSFEKGFEYIDESGVKQSVFERDLTSDRISELNSEYIETFRSIYLEKRVSDEEKALYKQLHDRYQFEGVRPKEVLMVSTSQKTDANDKRRIKASWSKHFESASSTFWAKNRYPDSCRFLFNEICKTDNPHYEQEISRFWLSVLTLSLNEISSSCLQAYRLYRLDVEVSHGILAQCFTDHLNCLETALVYARDGLSKIQETEVDAEKEVLELEAIPLSVETTDDGDTFLEVGANDVVSDSHALGDYNYMRQQSQKKLSSRVKNPRRAIDRAAKMVRTKANGFYGLTYELDEFQMDDLKESIRLYEHKVFTTRPKNIFNKKKTKETGEEVVKSIKEEIPEPMSSLEVFLAGLVALLLVILANLSYLMDCYQGGTLAYGIVLTVGIAMVTAIGGIIALKWHQRVMEDKIHELEKPMRDTADELQKSNSLFEDYFTNVCTYMKGQAMMYGSERCDDSCTTERKKYNDQIQALKEAIERDKQWMMNYDVARTCEERVCDIETIFDVNEIPRENKIYWLVPNDDAQSIVLNATGDTCDSPYKFVTQLYVEREEVFDDEELS